MAISVFDDKANEPTHTDVAKVLGDTATLWFDLKESIASRFDPLVEDWTFPAKNWGWSLRLKHKKRPILYMTPSTSFFYVGFALGEKAVNAAHERGLPQRLLDIIDSSQKYAEGRAVRLEVRSPKDLDGVLKLSEIKMAH